MLFPKDAPIRKAPLQTALAVLAMLFIFGLIVVGGVVGLAGIRGVVGGRW